MADWVPGEVLSGSEPYFDVQADSLRCYPLCAACREGAQVFGRGQPLTIPGSPLVL